MVQDVQWKTRSGDNLALSLILRLPSPSRFSSTQVIAGRDPNLEAILRRNVKAIAILNQTRGVPTVFIGVYRRVQRDFADGCRAARRYPSIDADSRRFAEADFVDQGHFSESGALKFASAAGPEIARACR
jgi:hypothetical protein